MSHAHRWQGARWSALRRTWGLAEPAAAGDAEWGRIAAPAVAIADVLDEAHGTLATAELAALLLGVERAAAPLSRGESPAAPPDPVSEGRVNVSPEVGGYLYPVAELMTAWARDVPGGRDQGAMAGLGRWVHHYVEDVASRPKGAAVPTTVG